MTAKIMYKKFQELFPDFEKRVGNYRLRGTNTLLMTLNTGETCVFLYFKKGNTATFQLAGDIKDRSSQMKSKEETECQ